MVAVRRRKRGYYDGKVPERHLPDLVITWKTAYARAVDEGLGDRPSGPCSSDPSIVAAAAMVKRSCSAGSFPEVYGGLMHIGCDKCSKEWARLLRSILPGWPRHSITEPGNSERWTELEIARGVFWEKRENGGCGHWQWSAPRRAALAVFCRALVLGMSPTTATRAVGVARHTVYPMTRNQKREAA